MHDDGEEAGPSVVDFGFNFGSTEKKVGGRRAKIHRDQKKKMRTGTFDSMGLSIPVLRAIKRKGYRLPTPIQRRAMPLIMQGVDLVGMARTGSGKTAVGAKNQVISNHGRGSRCTLPQSEGCIKNNLTPTSFCLPGLCHPHAREAQGALA